VEYLDEHGGVRVAVDAELQRKLYLAWCEQTRQAPHAVLARCLA
jgi:hypothetical protein